MPNNAHRLEHSFQETFWNPAQVVWWILLRNTHHLTLGTKRVPPFLGKITFAERAYVRLQLKAATNRQECSPAIRDFASAISYDENKQAEVNDLRLAIRNLGLVVLPNSPSNFEACFSRLRDMLPQSVDPDLLRIMLYQHMAGFRLAMEFDKALSDLHQELKRGSISASARQNALGGRIKLDRFIWPDYMILEVHERTIAVPSDDKSLQTALADFALNITGQHRDGVLPIWTHLLFEVAEVTRIWPAKDLPKNKRALAGAREKRLRDFHTVLEATIRRKWPKTRPSLNKMAAELEKDPALTSAGFKYDAIRKMLQNKYPPFQKLGLTVSTSHTHS